jgi:hypothetical protein
MEVPWTRSEPCRANLSSRPSKGRPDQKLLRAVVRAHVWLTDLKSGRYSSVEEQQLRIGKSCVRPKIDVFGPDITGSTLISNLLIFGNISALSSQKQISNYVTAQPPHLSDYSTS